MHEYVYLEIASEGTKTIEQTFLALHHSDDVFLYLLRTICSWVYRLITNNLALKTEIYGDVLEILYFISICLFFLTYLINPGTVGKSAGNIPFTVLLAKYEAKWLCPYCEIIVTHQSKHCYVCNKCTDNFDHHCNWVNNCIGKRNIHVFVLYLISMVLLLVQSILVVV